MSLNNLRVRAQLAVIVGIVVVAFAAIGGIYGYGVMEQEEFRAAKAAADHASNLASTLNYQILDTRRHEKDFLARRDERHLRLHAASGVALGKSVEALRSVADRNCKIARNSDPLRGGFRVQF